MDMEAFFYCILRVYLILGIGLTLINPGAQHIRPDLPLKDQHRTFS